MLKINLCLIIIFLTGCVSVEEAEYQQYLIEYRRMISQPTPDIWERNNLWHFTLTNASNNIVSTMILEFTEEVVQACTSGDWKQIVIRQERPIARETEPSDFPSKPAYVLNGSYLTIDLNSTLCGGGHELVGEINDLGVAGDRRSVHIFGGEHLGSFIGMPVNP